MTKLANSLMLATFLASSMSPFIGVTSAYAMRPDGSADYCAALELPEEDPAAKPAAPTPAPTPVPTTSPSPGTAATPADSTDKDQKATVPNIVDLVKKNTNAQEIVDTILGAVAPRSPDELEQEYNKLYNEITAIYVEPIRLRELHFEQYKTKYAGKIKNWADFHAAVSDMLTAVNDRWTSYTNPVDNMKQAIGQIEKMVPFGVMLHQQDDGTFLVEFIYPTYAADMGGIQEGDEIVSVDGHVLKGMNKDDAEKLMTKTKGTVISVVTNRHDGSPLVPKDYTLRFPDDGVMQPKFDLIKKKYAYLKMTDFMHPEVWEKLVASAKTADVPFGLSGVIVDWRYNSGGLVTLAHNAINTFMDPQGKIVPVLKEQERDGETTLKVVETNVYPMPAIVKMQYNLAQLGAIMDLQKLPLVIMVNGSTVSAPEVATEGLQEARPNTWVVGTQSFGKGYEMSVMKTADCGQVAITSNIFMPPSGKWLQGRGVTPDLVVHQSRDSREDLQLKAAVDLLDKKTASVPTSLASLDPGEIRLLPPPKTKPVETVKPFTFKQWLADHRDEVTDFYIPLAVLAIGLSSFFLFERLRRRASEQKK